VNRAFLKGEKMNKKQISVILIILLFVVISVLIIIPMLYVHRNPRWRGNSGKFLYDINRALQKYSLEHEGEMPSTLALLYPEYIDDKRVVEQIPLFAGQRMAIIYWHPQKLGDASTPVVEIVLDPSVKIDYPWRSFVLWGDGEVDLGQKQ
jgi:competence protein ComGC